MKILFVDPPMGAWVTWGNHISVNVAHVQIAACVRRDAEGVEVEALDCRAEKLDHDQMIEEIGKRKPDLIYLGDAWQMTETLAIIPHYKRAARMIKENFPEIKICAGGFYIAANYETIINETPDFDFVIAGEPDLTVVELCSELAKGTSDLSNIKGLCHRVDGKVVINEYRGLIKDLNELPMPAYDLFPMDKYVGYNTIDTYLELFTARGCPFGCSFCIDWVTMDPRGNRDWTKHRYKSAKNVVDEMELLNKEYGIDHFSIYDLNFNPIRKRVEEFTKELKERNLQNINFQFLGNAHSLKRDLDLLAELKELGLGSVIYGLEVTDDDELKKVGKGTTIEEIKEVTNALRDMNITSVMTWIIGFPDDDARGIKKRYAVLDDIDPDIMALQMMLPVPGIPMYDEVKEFCEVDDFNHWNFHEPVVRTKHLSREELGTIAAWANREFYSTKGRVQRVLENENINPFPLAIFKAYMTSMEDYARKASGDQAN